MLELKFFSTTQQHLVGQGLHIIEDTITLGHTTLGHITLGHITLGHITLGHIKLGHITL
jgi:hypothetical protein